MSGSSFGLPENLEDRIIPEPNSGCWLWIGYVAQDGYGQAPDAKGTRYAHRRVYEHLRGPVPNGLDLDHLCRVRCCVNPDHLEPVTAQTNTHRGVGPPADNVKKSFCKRGHPLSGDNLSIRTRSKSGRKERHCRTCVRMHARNYRLRKLGMGNDGSK